LVQKRFLFLLPLSYGNHRSSSMQGTPSVP
jgi:hypothetical protein